MITDDFSPAQRAARAFVENVLMPAFGDTHDGGIALARAVVAAVFSDFAEYDRLGDMSNARELLALATRAAAFPEEQHRAMLEEDERVMRDSRADPMHQNWRPT